jgi:hypothetical protein
VILIFALTVNEARRPAQAAKDEKEIKMKAFAITIWTILAAIFVIGLVGAIHRDDERNQKIEAATSPQEFISLEINEPKANVEVQRILDDSDSLFVTYDLDPWMMTGSVGKTNFAIELEKIIPGALSGITSFWTTCRSSPMISGRTQI